MGTSASYKAPTGGDWTHLKSEISKDIKSGNFSEDDRKKILNDFVDTKSSSSKSWNQSLESTSSKLSSFLSDISNFGLDKALENIGLSHLIGKSKKEICASLLDTLGLASNSIDQISAKNALDSVFKDLFKETETAKDVDSILREKVSENLLSDMLHDFIGNFIYESFCSNFYEVLLSKIGDDKLKQELSSIKKTIKASLKNITYKEKITNIDWKSQKGKEIINKITKRVFKIFGGNNES